LITITEARAAVSYVFSVNGREPMARFLTTALLALVLVSTFTVGVSTLTGFKISSLVLHNERDVLQMTPTDF
jgi:hypothetical protein